MSFYLDASAIVPLFVVHVVRGLGEFTYDLRTPCVGGKPIVVWEKQRRATARFQIQNVAVTMRRSDDVFSADEIVLVGPV